MNVNFNASNAGGKNLNVKTGVVDTGLCTPCPNTWKKNGGK